MIRIDIKDTDTGETVTTTIPAEHGPALRSALGELRNELGERSKGAYAFKKEHALTRAISAVGTLAGALNHVIAEDDRDY